MRGGALAMIEAVHLVLGGWHDVTFKWVVVTTFRCQMCGGDYFQMLLVYLLFVFDVNRFYPKTPLS
jgi:hypothetical protein